MVSQDDALFVDDFIASKPIQDRRIKYDANVLLSALQAMRDGNFNVRLPIHWSGIEGKIADTFNDIVATNARVTSELERIGKVVGMDGKTRQRMQCDRHSGAWGEIENSVNKLIDDLLWPTAEITRCISGVARGDFSQTVPLDVEGRQLQGEFLHSAKIANRMIDQMNTFTSEVTRVAREVGAEGKLGAQARVKGVAGAWKDLTDNVNSMANNLTNQVRNISEVTIAVANGDLSRKITVDSRGEILQLKEAINTMVDQLRSFSSEVTRVAREVGTEGKLGGQAIVPSVAGTWKDLTDSVNAMATNLTAQVRNIAEVTTAVARGDLSRKITVDVKGEILELKNTINTMVDQLNSFAAEVTRVAREVGTEGKLGGQAEVRGVAGTWKNLTDNVNFMASNLTAQVRNIAEVTTAVARGDLSRKITVDVKGEILQLKNTINTMVDQLNGFASEVTRVAREVGTEGKLGGQAKVPDVAGIWKDLTDNVNVMAHNLTDQVRGIVKVVTAVANGDLNQKLTVESKGEVAALAVTINSMTDTLAIFADQVTTVAREVGVEGRLGGQAYVPGASGTWKDLTANVNLLAANLTTQVRAIAEVATAVTTGDLTRYIQVDARGEVADLKNYINAMIGNLRKTTERNTEQDWLKTNLAQFSRMMQGQRDLTTVSQLLLSELAPLVEAQRGVIYGLVEMNGIYRLRQLAGYADTFTEDGLTREFRLGEGLIGQCALEKRRIIITNQQNTSSQTLEYPHKIVAGILNFDPRVIMILPVLFEGQVKAVIELASLKEFNRSHTAFLEQLTDIVGIVLNNIEVNMRTERLLMQSQQLAAELQIRQFELQQTNEELALKAQLLASQNAEVERKNQEIDQAKRAVEEKAAELALTSRYKSEFLANVSHELRTPLHSILILGEQLAENSDGNLSPKQVEFAQTIHAAGTDLLNLISDILDLSKIESGTVTVEYQELSFTYLRDSIERNFRHQAEARDLSFTTEFNSDLLQRYICSDPKRLLQILKNLLSNAFKFTEHGEVCFKVNIANQGWTQGHTTLEEAETVVAFSVSDTGVGIAPEKQKLIFEAFQQADSGTARHYGGTGLGLAISRELSQLLGGEIHLNSEIGKGSTFTLFLPLTNTKPLKKTNTEVTPIQFANSSPSIKPSMHHSADFYADKISSENKEGALLIIDYCVERLKTIANFAQQEGIKCLVSHSIQDTQMILDQYPIDAIILNMDLPENKGTLFLEHLKENIETRHIFVQGISTDPSRSENDATCLIRRESIDNDSLKQLLGNISLKAKPKLRRLLVVGPPRFSDRLKGIQDVELWYASDEISALQILHHNFVHCILTSLPFESSHIQAIAQALTSNPRFKRIPLIMKNDQDGNRFAELKKQHPFKELQVSYAPSYEQFLQEIILLANISYHRLSKAQQRVLDNFQKNNDFLIDKKVLIVDDDVRNIFALSSILERYQMNLITANNGLNAVEKIEKHDNISLVLMDLMMPGMDGYATIKNIRAKPHFSELPIIALTAKAMKGDREKCLEAGASDYIAKPVSTPKLISLLRKWLQHS